MKSVGSGAILSPEDRQASTLKRALLISLFAYVVVFVVGFFKADPTMVLPAGISLLVLLLPFFLIRRNHFEPAGILLGLTLLANLTVLATFGNGIHDVAIMAFPAIIIFSSLVLARRIFVYSVLATLLALAWLVFGEAFGFFTPRTPAVADAADFVLVAMTLLCNAAAVFVLSSNIRSSLDRANREIDQRRLVEEQLRYHSLFDLMTGIYNRNYFEQELARLEISRMYPVSVVVADLDGLKNVNDSSGHKAGDEILKEAATLLHSVFRAEDVLSRVGGDEFAALLPRTDATTAESIVDRIRNSMEEYHLTHPGTPIRLSLGTATAESSDLLAAFTLADRRMYEDKAARRGVT